MKPSEFKMTSGINFSTLARNASKFYNTRVIGIDNVSPEVSPIKTSMNSFSKKTPSPKWMQTSEKGYKKSNYESSRTGLQPKKGSEKVNRLESVKTEDTHITLSNIDSQIEQALKLQSLKNQEQRDFSNTDSISLFSRNHLDNHMESNESRPFSADICTINQDFGNRSRESPLKKEYQSIENIFAFKNETFDNKEELNRSSPIKEPQRVFSSRSLDYDDEITYNCENNQDLISVHDQYQMMKPEIFNLDMVESRSKFDRMRDFSAKSPNEHIVVNTNVRTSLHSQLDSKTNSRCSSIQKLQKSMEDLPLMLSSSKKNSEIKFTESRDQLSDRVSKFYFQKQTGFASENEAFDLGKRKDFIIFSQAKLIPIIFE